MCACVCVGGGGAGVGKGAIQMSTNNTCFYKENQKKYIA